jgi:hypothetical protein
LDTGEQFEFSVTISATSLGDDTLIRGVES